MNDNGIRTLVDGLSFAEGPRWREGKLWFSDFYTHRVLTLDGRGQIEMIAEVPGRPSGLGWTPEGKLLVVSMADRRLLRLDGDGLSTVADLSHLASGPCNDMVVDAAGRAYVGNFGFDRHQGEAERTTSLARVDPDGSSRAVADELLFPNGAAITPDGATLIVAETFANRLTAFSILADGGLSDRRTFAQFDDVFPDGICLDAEGAVWIADPRGKRVLRVFDGGRVAETISTGERGSYACMLGGDDRCTLYICTNVDSGPGVAEARAGQIDAVRVTVPGAGLP
jgi:sugar lactone lactonase YvrE